jgi:hypothetical protein
MHFRCFDVRAVATGYRERVLCLHRVAGMMWPTRRAMRSIDGDVFQLAKQLDQLLISSDLTLSLSQEITNRMCTYEMLVPMESACG